MMKHSQLICKQNTETCSHIIVTVRAKTSLVHTFNFANLQIHNFCYDKQKQLKFSYMICSANITEWLPKNLGLSNLAT